MASNQKTPLLSEDCEVEEADFPHKSTTDDVVSLPEQRQVQTANIDDATYLQTSENSGSALDGQLKSTTSTYSVTRARWVSSVSLWLYCMGAYTNMTVVQQYLIHRWSHEANVSVSTSGSVCFRNESDPRYEQEDDIQARVSTSISYYSYCFSMPSLVVSVVLGAYSDVIGRRKTLLLPMATSLGKFVSIIFIFKYDLNTDLFYMSCALEGIGGAYFVVLIAAFSITADLNSQKSWRMLWINILICLNQTMTAGFSIGIGYVIDYFGFVAAGVMLLVPVAAGFFLALFFLPETHPKAEGRDLNFLSNVGRMIKLYTSFGSRRCRICMIICLLIFFFSVIGILNISSIDTLYQLHEPFCWDARQISYYSASIQGASAVVGVIYHATAQWCGCVSDEMVAMIGMVFQAGSMVVEAFAKTNWMIYLVPVLKFPFFPVTGIIRGVMSILAGPYNQGALFASISVAEAICSLVSNTVLFQFYSATVHKMPGAVYLLISALGLVCVFLFLPFFYFYKKLKNDDKNMNANRKMDASQSSSMLS